MTNNKPTYIQDVEKFIDRIIELIGTDIVFYTPLAIGKPSHIVNALYKRVKQDARMNLTILTCIPLQTPKPGSDLETRLLGPVFDRSFEGHVNLDFFGDVQSGTTPDNFKLVEFYMIPGASLNNPKSQQNFLLSNFMHVVRDTLEYGVNLIGMTVARQTESDQTCFSISTKPDITLQLNQTIREEHRKGRRVIFVAQVDDNLPYMYGDAELEADQIDIVLGPPEFNFNLFGIPSELIDTRDHMMGFYASTLIRDGGTLQVGIGSLGDSVGNALIMRHRHSKEYRELNNKLDIAKKFGNVVRKSSDDFGSFEKGLYGSTEMFGYGYIKLLEAGIRKRNVLDCIPLQQLLVEGEISEEVNSRTLDVLLENQIIEPLLTQQDFDFLQKYGIIIEDAVFEENRIIYKGESIPADFSDAETRRTIDSHLLGSEIKGEVFLHASFFHGPKVVYDSLCAMPDGVKRHICMTGVSYTNHPYGNETLKRLRRQSLRFVNSAIMVSLPGAINCETLEDGRVISDIGGQFNFVSMAHEIEDGRSIIMIRSTRDQNGKAQSNIVFNYGNVSVPRHFRDILVSEYGIADLRGKVDKDTIAEMLNIADLRFQEELLQKTAQFALNSTIQ